MPTHSGVDHLTGEYIHNRYEIPLSPLEKETTGIRTPDLVLLGDLKLLNQVWILPVPNRAGAKMILAFSPGRLKAIFFDNSADPLWIHL